jgi:hypothetical protein
MKHVLFALLASTPIAFANCAESSTLDSEAFDSLDDGGDVNGKGDSAAPSALQVEIGCGSEASLSQSLSGTRIDGDILKVQATYGGGCQAHKFKVCWDGGFAESLPAQANLKLIHTTAAPDNCEALLSSDLTIDLSKIADTFRVTKPAGGKVSVNLGTQTKLYTFAARLDFAGQFAAAAQGANYISESDSTPTFITAPIASGKRITKTFIRQTFGAQLGLVPTDAMQFSNRAEAIAFMLRNTNPDLGDAASIAAWARINDLLKAKMTSLVLIKVGPGENGKLLDDAGEYKYLVVGKTADGKVSGFFVVAVET